MWVYETERERGKKEKEKGKEKGNGGREEGLFSNVWTQTFKLLHYYYHDVLTSMLLFKLLHTCTMYVGST